MKIKNINLALDNNKINYLFLKKRELIEKFSINPIHLINYVNALEEHYQNVPYHNKTHAADVTQSIHVLLNSGALEVIYIFKKKKVCLF